MESMVVGSERRRGRKRKRKDGENLPVDQQLKKPVVGTRSKALLGRYLKKEFDSGVYLGKIVFYETGLYRVEYEDGDCEDLDSGEVKKYLIPENYFDGDLRDRKTRLDELVSKKDVKDVKMEHLHCPTNAVEGVESSSSSELSNHIGNEADCVNCDGEADADSSSDSCEYSRDRDMMFSEDEVPIVPPPELPSSSGTIGIPEDYVSYLFSVYGFLRSFSIRLFLSPFGLDEFVGSLNCPVANTLLDSIHVALLRALRSHMETVSSDGFELASRCLRCMDWKLLDSLTWPVYLIEYLMVMGYTRGRGLDWKRFFNHALERDYYTLSAGTKLVLLQILCDDVLDSEELQAEINILEEFELGEDSEADVSITRDCGYENGQLGHSKESTCKELNYVAIPAEYHGTKTYCSSASMCFSGVDVAGHIDQDGNGDECRLCSMDGTLLCCDGCPSAYHTRCIGLNKLSIPEEKWYCPECCANRTGPIIRKGSSLRGADVFGVDLYGQIFLATCNHLLVLKISNKLDSCVRYYNPNDIVKVIQALQASVEHTATYSGICKSILHYWGIPAVSFVGAEFKGGVTLKANEMGSTELITSSPAFLVKDVQNDSNALEGDKAASCVTQNVAVTCEIPGIIDGVMHAVSHSCHASQQMNADTISGQSGHQMDTRLGKQIKMEPSITTSSISQQVDPSDLTQQNLSDKSSIIENCTYLSRNGNGGIRKGDAHHASFTTFAPFHWKEVNNGIGRSTYKNPPADCLYMGFSFKSPAAYINNYFHGRFAASAAANLAILSSDESRISESNVLDKPRKVLSVNISFQAKAFSSAATRFFWPHSEKKLVEGPRERCGWCLSCKAPITSKKACLLNGAVSNAIKGATKTLSRLCHVKNGDANFAGIATYIMFLEESLCGLTSGLFLDTSFREEWRRKLENATTLSTIKFLLLELERNIRAISFSGDWFKLVNIWSVGSPVTQSATSITGSTQKRAPGGRRGRKPTVVTETANNEQDILTDFLWWRGGLPSKHIFQKGTLPSPVLKKAARQGASRNIPGICYAEGFVTPLRSRQLVWRASVGMSKNTSQLALQVRLLDHHVRWSDLVRSEQIFQEGKGSETEASAFRNASICNKKFIENATLYGVAFGNQKHLPSRVMKNVTEVEQFGDGKEIYWFFESRIPLYLIKEYEHVGKAVLVSSEKPAVTLTKLQRKHSKAYRKDIFSYLVRKRDYMDEISCSSCQLVLLLGDAVKCSSCQGSCHPQCCVSSTVHVNEEVGFRLTCNGCYNNKAHVLEKIVSESPNSPLLLQGREFQNASDRVGKHPGHTLSLMPGGILEHFETKTTNNSSSASKSKRKTCSWGLIWNKKKPENAGIDFRLKNILLKGNPDGLTGPECHTCHQPYNCNLMYIRCETCQNWYHAEAVELEESKIFKLLGFKCCRCRRIKPPDCPYNKKVNKMQLESNKARKRAPKPSRRVGAKPDSGPIAELRKDGEGATLPFKEEDIPKSDPLLLSLPMVDQFANKKSEGTSEWNTVTSGPVPQKRPVRRQMKCEMDDGFFVANNASEFELATHSAVESLPFIEQDASANGFEEQMMFDYECLDYEDMEFEPQTYFSFTELLACDDGGRCDTVDQSDSNAINWEKVLIEGKKGACNSNCHQQEHVVKTVAHGVDIVPCKSCSLVEPLPDLFCQVCGLWIHGQCSPWSTDSGSDGCWRCGICREWR